CTARHSCDTAFRKGQPLTRQILIIVITSFVLAEISTFATSIYLHRALSHRSLSLHPFAAVLFRAALWLLTGQSRQQWVAVHRKHHTFADREGDPHSPLLLGFWKVQLWNVYYYIREARQPKTVEIFAPDLGPDRWERHVFSWGWTGLFLGTALVALAIGWWQSILAMLGHGIIYMFILAPLINGLGHWWGGQNFENTAYNSRLLFARAGLAHGRREPAQQPPRVPALAEVQSAPLGARSVVDRDPLAGGAQAGGHRGRAAQGAADALGRRWRLRRASWLSSCRRASASRWSSCAGTSRASTTNRSRRTRAASTGRPTR